MKICVLGKQERYEKFKPECELTKTAEIVYFPLGTGNEEILRKGGNAQVIFVDAIGKVEAGLIEAIPNLKLIQSEGVAYNGVDTWAAARRGVYVCNCKGINATAVAEHAILLILALLRTLPEGHQAVIHGEQIKRKEWLMLHGIPELCEQTVGLIGFGDIGKATAKLLAPFGCEVFYNSLSPKDSQIEEEYNARYLPLDDLLARSTIVSLHLPVTAKSSEIADKAFFDKMQDNSWFINTSRGELVKNDALKAALISGKLAGAGLDTIAPEPVTMDNPLLDLPEEVAKKIILSPHSAGITTATFRRSHSILWSNAAAIERGERPKNIVNGL